MEAFQLQTINSNSLWPFFEQRCLQEWLSNKPIFMWNVTTHSLFKNSFSTHLNVGGSVHAVGLIHYHLCISIYYPYFSVYSVVSFRICYRSIYNGIYFFRFCCLFWLRNRFSHWLFKYFYSLFVRIITSLVRKLTH